MLPIVRGDISNDILEHELSVMKVIETEALKKKGMVKYLDGACVFVRLEDAQMPGTFAVPFQQTSLNYIPAKTKAKYRYDRAKIAQQATKTGGIKKLLPKKMESKEFEKAMNVAFSQEMDITHYSF